MKVTSLRVFASYSVLRQANQADLPHSKSFDTVSWPVNTRHAGSVSHLTGPSWTEKERERERERERESEQV